ncbi:DUF362 domain-containing protein [Candidatus Neomarinimicrobiota bacterium]
MKRRDFIKTSATGIAGFSLLPAFLRSQDRPSLSVNPPDVVWIENGEPAELIRAAIGEFGGIEQFISKGDIVVIKPNIGFDRMPRQAATTNPDLVAEVVKQCRQAGAKKIKVFDRSTNNPQRCYYNSEIEKKAKAAGAQVYHVYEHRFKEIDLPNGEVIKKWPVYVDYIEADKTINIPIAKQHSMDRVTLGQKNLMGIMGGNRGEIHNGFSKKLADITSAIMPTFTIIDAYRILTANGPSGGSTGDVKTTRTLIMSRCTVTADYAALPLFDLSVNQVGHISEMVERGQQKCDLDNLKLRKIDLS